MRPGLTALLCAFALASPTSAQTYITNVSPDIQAEPPTLRIHGSGFGGNPRVFMGLGGGALPLILLEVSQTEILAELPTTTEGSYLLVVLPQGGGADLFEFAIGQADLHVESPLVIVDSLGAVVGPVVGFIDADSPGAPRIGEPLVLFQHDGEKIVLHANLYGLHLNRPMYFDGPGCTGQAKIDGLPIEGDLQGMQELGYGIGPGRILYRGTECIPDGSYQSRTCSISGCSFRPPSDDWTGGCNNEVGDAGTNRTIAASPVLDFDDLFAAPFKMK